MFGVTHRRKPLRGDHVISMNLAFDHRGAYGGEDPSLQTSYVSRQTEIKSGSDLLVISSCGAQIDGPTAATLRGRSAFEISEQ